MYGPRNTKIVAALDSGIERYGYTVAEHDELLGLLPSMSHDWEFLKQVELLDMAVSFSVKEWDRLNEEFTAGLNVAAFFARGIARDIKAGRL